MNAMSRKISMISRAFNDATKLYKTVTCTDLALKQQLLDAVDDIYTETLCQPHVGFAGNKFKIITKLVLSFLNCELYFTCY